MYLTLFSPQNIIYLGNVITLICTQETEAQKVSNLLKVELSVARPDLKPDSTAQTAEHEAGTLPLLGEFCPERCYY